MMAFTERSLALLMIVTSISITISIIWFDLHFLPHYFNDVNTPMTWLIESRMNVNRNQHNSTRSYDDVDGVVNIDVSNMDIESDSAIVADLPPQQAVFSKIRGSRSMASCLVLLGDDGNSHIYDAVNDDDDDDVSFMKSLSNKVDVVIGLSNAVLRAKEFHIPLTHIVSNDVSFVRKHAKVLADLGAQGTLLIIPRSSQGSLQASVVKNDDIIDPDDFRLQWQRHGAVFPHFSQADAMLNDNRGNDSDICLSPFVFCRDIWAGVGEPPSGGNIAVPFVSAQISIFLGCSTIYMTVLGASRATTLSWSVDPVAVSYQRLARDFSHERGSVILDVTRNSVFSKSFDILLKEARSRLTVGDVNRSLIPGTTVILPRLPYNIIDDAPLFRRSDNSKVSLAIVVPFRTGHVAKLVDTISRRWQTPEFFPCHTDHKARGDVDLVFWLFRQYEPWFVSDAPYGRRGRLRKALYAPSMAAVTTLETLKSFSGLLSAAGCFRRILFLSADLPRGGLRNEGAERLGHWDRNLQLLSLLEDPLITTRYDSVFYMDPNTHAIRAGWVDAAWDASKLVISEQLWIAGSSPSCDVNSLLLCSWVIGSNVEHSANRDCVNKGINMNALYSLHEHAAPLVDVLHAVWANSSAFRDGAMRIDSAIAFFSRVRFSFPEPLASIKVQIGNIDLIQNRAHEHRSCLITPKKAIAKNANTYVVHVGNFKNIDWQSDNSLNVHGP